jgi:hypothetical protein
MKLVDKINITQIVKNHIATLVNYNTKKAGIGDYFTFFLIPAIIAGTLFYFDVHLTFDAINIIIISLSIFIGLLFNVILLIFDIVHRDSTTLKLKKAISKELLANIAFTVFLSIVSILSTLITYVKYTIVKHIFEVIVYFVLSLFLVTILMILKRMYLLFKHEVDTIDEK